MKKCISAVGLLLVLMIPVAVQADDYTYTTNNGAITITGYTGLGGALSIPDEINGLPVVGLGERAFEGKTNLTSVVIPNSITNVARYVFQSCRGITNATLSANATVVGYSMFNGCRLNSIIIPETVRLIEQQAFYQCSMSNVVIPANVTNISRIAFGSCSNLKTITVDTNNVFYSDIDGVLFDKQQITINAYPAGKTELDYAIPVGVTKIGDSAFWGAATLTNVNIPNTITDIEQLVFAGCSQLSDITIPASVTSIGFGPFSSCYSLSQITVEPLNETYVSVDGVLFSTNHILVQYPAGNSSESYSIPAGIITIGDSAFHSCKSLTKVTIPSSVTSIGYNSFYGCTFTSITIPSNVVSIGSQAFLNCTKLNGVFFQGDAPSFVSSAFNNATNAIVYYYPRTTGWETTFAGRPTFLWNPTIQSYGSNFGVKTNGFGFNITGTTNFVVKVEACTNLTSGIWEPLQTGTITNGSLSFSDPQSTNYAGRFYRLSMP